MDLRAVRQCDAIADIGCRLLCAGAAGFLMWKVAVVGYSAMPSLGQPPHQNNRMQNNRM